MGVLGAGTAQKGGHRCGHSPKRGVLGGGTVPKGGLGNLFIYYLYFFCRNDQLMGGHGSGRLNNGGLRCGHRPKGGGVLGGGTAPQKGGGGVLFIYYLYFCLSK